jgi:nitronate monooxygenase
VGGQFEDVKDLVAGKRGVKVYEIGDLDAGIDIRRWGIW